MIKQIAIENYKSIQKLKIDLGRINVFIGENGCGKSNILEAIALGSAAEQNKLDNEFLFSRGIRVTNPKFMRSAFDNEQQNLPVKLEFRGETASISSLLQNDEKPYSSWYNTELDNSRLKWLKQIDKQTWENILSKISEDEYFKKWLKNKEELSLEDFIIYSPENTVLRRFSEEGQIQPLGINGEGLFKLIKVLSTDIDRFEKLKKSLAFIDWFEDFSVPNSLSEGEYRLEIKDRYLDTKSSYFTQKSANEGFLFLLFYFALLISDKTPTFFAVDNVDASLNPKMCTKLMEEMVRLAKQENKQAILTTHNAALLDGLNLDDNEQRLFVISRNVHGHTKAKRILKPKREKNQEPMKLSTMLLRGYLGGLPKGF